MSGGPNRVEGTPLTFQDWIQKTPPDGKYTKITRPLREGSFNYSDTNKKGSTALKVFRTVNKELENSDNLNFVKKNSLIQENLVTKCKGILEQSRKEVGWKIWKHINIHRAEKELAKIEKKILSLISEEEGSPIYRARGLLTQEKKLGALQQNLKEEFQRQANRLKDLRENLPDDLETLMGKTLTSKQALEELEPLVIGIEACIDFQKLQYAVAIFKNNPDDPHEILNISPEFQSKINEVQKKITEIKEAIYFKKESLHIKTIQQDLRELWSYQEQAVEAQRKGTKKTPMDDFTLDMNR